MTDIKLAAGATSYGLDLGFSTLIRLEEEFGIGIVQFATIFDPEHLRFSDVRKFLRIVLVGSDRQPLPAEAADVACETAGATACCDTVGRALRFIFKMPEPAAEPAKE